MTTRRISVWAPAAQRVDLIAGDRAQTMEESGGGWFVCNGELANRDDYAFSVDGSEAMPDPRSDRSRPGSTGLHNWSSTREPANPAAGGDFPSGTRSSTSCMSARSRRKALSMRRSRTWTTSSRSAPTRSNSCLSQSFPDSGDGATTVSTSSRPIAATVVPMGSAASSMRPTIATSR